ncbi:MAG: hypothetical protein JWO47_31 [Candidatus Saccharibacteria bacterium]|nr:hypothetical protein [Candidatus Saccharibacteria bacterium]
MSLPKETLDIHSVTAFAGGVNTEYRVLLLQLTPAFGSNSWANPLYTLCNLQSFDTSGITSNFRPGYLKQDQERMVNKGFLAVRSDGTYQRNLAGEIALGFGGLQLETGINTGVPIKTLVGEGGQGLRPDGTIRDGVESRLATLLAFYNRAPNKWFPFKELVSDLEPLKTGEEGTRHTLKRLVQANLAEQRLVAIAKKSGNHSMQVRMRKREGIEYRTAVGQYLGNVISLATMDVERLAAGQQFVATTLESVKTDPKKVDLVSELLERTQRTTPRFGKSPKKK